MKTIETKKAASVQEVVELIRRLNFRNDTFEYRFTTRERVNGVKIEYRQFDAYLPNGEIDSFAIDEIVVNGKLEVVRFFNLFRDIIVDFRIGDFTPDYSKVEQVIDADAQIALANVTDVPETDGSEEDDDDNVFALVPELDELNDVEIETADDTSYYVVISMFGNKTPMFSVTVNGKAITNKRGGSNLRKKEVDEWILQVHENRSQYSNMTITVSEEVATLHLDSFACNPRFIHELNVTLTGMTGNERRAIAEYEEFYRPDLETIIDDYAVSTEAQDAAIDAEIELANNEKEINENNVADTDNNGNITVESARANGLSFVEFMAAKAGLTLEQYAAKQEQEEAAIQAYKLNLKIKALKNSIANYELNIAYNIGAINDIFNNHWKIGTNDGYEEWANELAVEIANNLNKIAKLNAKLATLTPNAEYQPQTNWDNPHDFTIVGDLSDRNINGRIIAANAKGETTLTDNQKLAKQITDNDDFNAKLDALQAKVVDARDNLADKQKALDTAQKKFLQANAELEDANREINQLGDAKAAELRELLTPKILNAPKITIISQDGVQRKTNLKSLFIYFDGGNGGFRITVDKEASYIIYPLAFYDTPEQVTTVINKLKAAIARGDSEFTFPTVDELNQPPFDKEAVMLETVVTEEAQATAVYCEMELADNNLFGADPNADNYTMARYITSAVFTDTDGYSVINAIRSTDFVRAEKALQIFKEEFAGRKDLETCIEYNPSFDVMIPVCHVAELDGSEEDFDADNIWELIPTPDDLNDVDTEENVTVDVAADFDDSLIRGMKFSLEKIQALCLSINRSKQTDLTAVSYEWELYNIQRKALFRKEGA